MRLHPARAPQPAAPTRRPSRPASKASAIRVILRPALTRPRHAQRCSKAKQPFRHSAPASCVVGAQCREAYRQPANSTGLISNDGNDRAILVQGDEGPAQVVRLGHQGHSISWLQRRWCHFPSPPAHTISPQEGGTGIRTLGPFTRISSVFFLRLPEPRLQPICTPIMLYFAPLGRDRFAHRLTARRNLRIGSRGRQAWPRGIINECGSFGRASEFSEQGSHFGVRTKAIDKHREK